MRGIFFAHIFGYHEHPSFAYPGAGKEFEKGWAEIGEPLS